MGLRKNSIKLSVFFFAFCVIILFIKCSIMNPGEPENKNGSIVPVILFKTNAAPEIDFVEDIEPSIREVEIIIKDASGGTIQKRFPYTDKQARISEVPEGDAKLTVNAFDNMNTIVMTGTVDVKVIANQTVSPVCHVQAQNPDNPYLTIPRQITCSAVVLRWVVWKKDLTSLEEFILDRKEGGEWIEIQRLNKFQKEAMDIENIQMGMHYDYRVRMKMAVGEHISNVQGIGTVNMGPAMQVPVLIGYKVTAPNSVEIVWKFKNYISVSGFEIERSDDGLNFAQIYKGRPSFSMGPDTAAYSDPTVVKYQKYFYRVRAFFGNETSEYSNVMIVNIIQEVGLDIAPNNLSLNLQAGGEVKVVWEFPALEQDKIRGFEIRHTADSSIAPIVVGSVGPAEREYLHTSPRKGVNYYQVCSKDMSGDLFCGQTGNIEIR